MVGYQLMMAYSLEPEDATNKVIHWRSGNAEIATVNESGSVQGKAGGSVFIFAETEDGNKKDSCEIIVMPGNEFTVYFSKPDSWASTIKIYYWDAEPAGIFEEVFWPGLDMSFSDGWYHYTFTGVSFTNLIFNDHSPQHPASFSQYEHIGFERAHCF